MLHPEQQHLKLTTSSACIAALPIRALVSCHSHSNAPLTCSHTSFATPLPCTTWLYIGHSVPCVHLHWFLLPLLILILKGLPSSSPDILLWRYQLKYDLACDIANPHFSGNTSTTLVLEGGNFSWWQRGTFWPDVNWDWKDFKTRLY